MPFCVKRQHSFPSFPGFRVTFLCCYTCEVKHHQLAYLPTVVTVVFFLSFLLSPFCVSAYMHVSICRFSYVANHVTSCVVIVIKHHQHVSAVGVTCVDITSFILLPLGSTAASIISCVWDVKPQKLVSRCVCINIGLRLRHALQDGSLSQQSALL